MIDGSSFHRRDAQHEESLVSAHLQERSEVQRFSRELDAIRPEIDRMVRCIISLQSVDGVSPETWLQRAADCIREGAFAGQRSVAITVIDRPLPSPPAPVSTGRAGDSLRTRDEPMIFVAAAPDQGRAARLESQQRAVDRWLCAWLHHCNAGADVRANTPLLCGQPMASAAEASPSSDTRGTRSGVACHFGADLGYDWVHLAAGPVSIHRPHDRTVRTVAVAVWCCDPSGPGIGGFGPAAGGGGGPKSDAHSRLWHRLVLANLWTALTHRYSIYRERFDRNHRLLLDRLTPAQRRIAQLMLQGVTEREIANRISRSQHTVHEHVKAIYRAWNVRSRAEFMAVWLSAATVSPEVAGLRFGIADHGDDADMHTRRADADHHRGEQGADSLEDDHRPAAASDAAPASANTREGPAHRHDDDLDDDVFGPEVVTDPRLQPRRRDIPVKFEAPRRRPD